MIQALLVGVGGELETHFIGRVPASCNVDVIDIDGTTKLVDNGVCVLDSATVNTTSTSAVAEDVTVVPVASAAGITTRRRYLFGDEEVTVKSVTGLNVTLCAPLERPHASGSTFVGMRVSFMVGAGVASAEKLNLRAVFKPNSGEYQAEAVEFAANVIPRLLISEVDIRKEFPKDKMSLSAELDLPAALADARDEMVLRLGGRHRAHVLLGIDHLRVGCRKQFWLSRRGDLGDAHRADMDQLERGYESWICMVDAQAPRVAGDGTVAAAPGKLAFPQMNLGAA